MKTAFHFIKIWSIFVRMNKADVLNIRDEIITAALPDIMFDGWTWENIVHAAEKVGHKEAAACAVFPERIVDVLDGFTDLADREMLKSLAQETVKDLRIRERIYAGVVARLQYLQPHKEAVRSSVAFWALPTRKIRAAKIIWRTADQIWTWAGDESTDYNHYTKRGLLSGILVSTTLVWLDDESEDMHVTKAFLDRRIENVLAVGQTVGRFMNRFKRAS